MVLSGPGSVVETTAQDVIRQLCVAPSAERELEAWKADRPEVADFVLGHTTRTAYRLDVSALTPTVEETEHALGDSDRRRAEAVRPIMDWNPRFAFTHVLHYALEELDRAPRYEEFRDFCRSDPIARQMLWDPAQEMIAETSRTTGTEAAKNAMRWRIGNAYYSFLRELVVFVRLRDRGLPIQTHPLADALFRVDVWAESTAVSLYIKNSFYRDGTAGRKKQTAQLLGPAFDYISIDMPTQHTFGKVHVPSERTIDDAATRIARTLRR